MAAVATCSVVTGLACTGSDEGGGGGGSADEEVPTATLGVSVQFPNEVSENTTATVHVWVLDPDESNETTCAALVGGDIDPYDHSHRRIADAASQDTRGLEIEAVEIGDSLVYVEAVDDLGNVEWAGCVSIDLTRSGDDVTVELGPARVYDCGDSATEDDAPCDDGLTCTVGERCHNGECTDGTPRSCDHITDGCNAGTCDEELGCITVLLTDGTPCDDGFFCTSGEICTAGECVGVDRDCEEQAGECMTVVGCDELNDQCVTQQSSSGTSCDDGFFCTSNDTCDFYGECSGSTPTCDGGGCSTGTCDEAMDRCTITGTSPLGTSCDDGSYCTSLDSCDGDGNCVGIEEDCSDYESACYTATCNPTTGSCETIPKVDGAPCEYSSTGCYAEGTCQFGSCTAEELPNGTPCESTSYPCYTNTCSFGSCQPTTALPNGTACESTSYPCYVTTCQTGSCTPSPSYTYLPTGTPCDYSTSDPCYIGECNGSGSCTGSLVGDEDGDGYSTNIACSSPIDCDDDPVTGPSVYPYTLAEGYYDALTCTDGIDNDCDTLIDALDTSYCP